MKQLTFGDLIEFILKNKSDKTFIGQSLQNIIDNVGTALDNETLFYAVDESGNITGMILAEIREEAGVLFVTENLAMSINTLKGVAKKARIMFPQYKLEWLKRGIHKKHDTNKIYSKLTI